MSKITIGPSHISIVVNDAQKASAESWLNSIVPGGLSFVAQLAVKSAPTVRVAWHAGVSVDDQTMSAIASGADARGVGYLVLERYEGIDTQEVSQMTLKRVTNRTTHLAALDLVPKEDLL